MNFPSEALLASSGRVYCYLHENVATGLRRGLYWGCEVDFEPLSFEGDDQICSMTCEWIPWGIRSWRELDGRSIRGPYGHQGIEASFYARAHERARTVELSLRSRGSAMFDLSMSMVVDYSGFAGGAADHEMEIAAQVVAPFEGVWLRPQSYDPAPSSDEEIEALAGEFLDLSEFRITEDPTGACVLRPRLD